MWILIMIITSGGFQLEHIPGFASEKVCSSAGETLKAKVLTEVFGKAKSLEDVKKVEGIRQSFELQKYQEREIMEKAIYSTCLKAE